MMDLAVMARVCCCSLMCLGVIGLNFMETAVAARNDFQRRNMREQTQWILDYLRCHSHRAEHVKYTFILGTTTICMMAWRLVYGISEGRLNDLCRKFKGKN